MLGLFYMGKHRTYGPVYKHGSCELRGERALIYFPGLLRMLRSLLSAQGVSPQMITVFIDGYYEVSAAGVSGGPGQQPVGAKKQGPLRAVKCERLDTFGPAEVGTVTHSDW